MKHAGLDGKHDFAVHLISNDGKQPDVIIQVLSDWGQQGERLNTEEQ